MGLFGTWIFYIALVAGIGGLGLGAIIVFGASQAAREETRSCRWKRRLSA